MKSNPVFASSSRQRLEEFRSKLESAFSSKPIHIDKAQNHREPFRKVSPLSRYIDFTEDIQRSITPKQASSPTLNHYRNLSYFKTQASSPKAQTKKSKDLFKASIFSANLDAMSYGDKKREKLSDIISIETLSAATKVLSGGGTKAIPRVYAAQLKDFCTEVLAKIR